MTKVAVIGAGPAGMIFTYALLRSGKGYDVTVYSDRTPEQWLNHCAPTGTAFHYENVIDIEKNLGMDHWHEDAFHGEGVLLDFCPHVGAERMVVAGRWPGRGAAIDQRLRVSHWLNEVESLGARLVIEAVTAKRADEIARQNDLTVLAAGKGELGRIIPRDPERSVYDAPQRNLAMAICTGITGWDHRIDLTPVKFYFFGDIGEFFWVPYTHKTAGPTWCVLFEAKPGKALDRFGDCRSGEEVVAIAKTLMREFTPWDYEVVKDMRIVPDDPYAWLKGRFPPTVRQPFGRLPSGGLIMPVGDTAITFDPIGGQGGNTALRNAKFTADRVIARGDGPFDEEWMRAVNTDFWREHGWAAYTFNNILLEPLEEAGRILLSTAARSRRFADDFMIGNFPTPNNYFPYIQDPQAARQLVAPYLAEGEAETGPDGGVQERGEQAR